MLYGYDSNGNITHDGDSDVDFTYDYQNHVQKAEYNGSLLAKYSYLADGTKVEAVDGGGNGLRYIGSLVYKKQSGIAGVSLESAAFGGGRFRVSQGADGVTYIPNYYITDHLGSTRAIVENGQATAEYNYYPYGSEWSTANMLHSDDNRYKFSGKELQSDFGANLYDFHARTYTPLTTMFIQQDPKSQDYYSISPYAYCAGNPVSNIDIDGCKLDPTSKSLQKQLQIIMCQTKTGRKQYEKLITNESIIKVVILKDYMSEKQIAGENSLQRLRRIPSTREIIGGICEITISLAAVADFAKAEGLTVTERLAATLAEEVQHTELENILLQLEERQEEQSTGRKIDYKDKKSEQQAHIYRDKVIEEYKQYKK